MMHPSRQNRVSNSAVTKGLGIIQTAVNPTWESKSYSKNIIYFNSGNVAQQRRLLSCRLPACNWLPTIDLTVYFNFACPTRFFETFLA